MLTNLSIRNIVLIEKADVSLSAGFSVFTGETGAGKSMLMDALSLSLGARSDSQLIRNGKDRAEVVATFDISKNPSVFKVLEALDIVFEDNDVILKRVLTSDGKSKAFINGVRVTNAQLKQVGECLADIHGQHDQQLLLNHKNHVLLLDQFGGLEKEAVLTKSAYRLWKKLTHELNSLLETQSNQERDQELLTAWVEELDILATYENEENELVEERTKLMAGESIVSAFKKADKAVNSNNVTSHLATAERAIQSIAHKAGEDVEKLLDRISNIYAEVADVSTEISHMQFSFEPDMGRLTQVDDRLVALRDVARKHKVSVAELVNLREEFKQKLQEFANIDDNIHQKRIEVNNAWDELEKVAEDLSVKRKSVASDLSKAIESALSGLHMAGTRFVAEINELPKDEWNALGKESIEFLVATNAGQSLNPLAKVASGGEVSRLMLALKSVFYAKAPAQTLVFDEIDTGIGGAVADAAGKAMRQLSSKHQVFSISHQPQVAALGHHHLKIQKSDVDGKTTTSIVELIGENRTEEVARMLSGDQITPATKAAAEDLLKGAA